MPKHVRKNPVAIHSVEIVTICKGPMETPLAFQVQWWMNGVRCETSAEHLFTKQEEARAWADSLN